MSRRMRLAAILCAYYARLGFSDYVFAIMGLLHRVGCMLHCGASTRRNVTLEGGRVLTPQDLSGAWDDVLSAISVVRSAFGSRSPAAPPCCFGNVSSPKRARKSEFCVRGVQRTAHSAPQMEPTAEEVD